MASTKQMQERAKAARKAAAQAAKATHIVMDSDGNVSKVEGTIEDSIEREWVKTRQAFDSACIRNRANVDLELAFNPIYTFNWEGKKNDFYRNKFVKDLYFKIFDIEGKPFARGHKYCVQLHGPKGHIGVLVNKLPTPYTISEPAQVAASLLIQSFNWVSEALFKGAFGNERGFRQMID